MMFDFEDVFVVRATNPENNDFIITIGNRFATPKHYESREEAENDNIVTGKQIGRAHV